MLNSTVLTKQTHKGCWNKIICLIAHKFIIFNIFIMFGSLFYLFLMRFAAVSAVMFLYSSLATHFNSWGIFGALCWLLTFNYCHRFSIRFKSGFIDGHAIAGSLTHRTCALGHCPVGKPIVVQALKSYRCLHFFIHNNYIDISGRISPLIASYVS